MSDPPKRPVPARLADFEVVRRLGVGGMAEVFLAKKRGAEGTFKLLVLKRILPQFGASRRFRAMFAEEAQLATRLNHPNIVQVYEFQDYGEEGQLLSMEYVEGPDLRRLIRAAQAKNMRLPPYVAAYIVGEVAKGLHYAHERRDEGGDPLDIVHRDVSPQNILLSFDGAVKIADFGIASANLFREEPGTLKGKTGYMSPEQARGERADRRTDVYSLGVVLHELLTGRLLHGADEGAALLEAVRSGQVEPPSTYAREVPPDLEAITMRALAKEIEERFASAREFTSALTRALFQRQQIVDAHVLEAVIAQLVDRNSVPAGPVPEGPFEERRVESTVPPASTGDQSSGSGAWREDSTGGIVTPRRPPRSRAGREVRHVAVIRIAIHGFDALVRAMGPSIAEQFAESLRGVLDEVAFKRGAKWSWDVAADEILSLPTSARATVGLLENPARAAIEAARLAIDVHEAVQGACDDLPVKLHASIGVVRGIASGVRDKAGHLIEHQLQEPAGYLAERLGKAAPTGTTWAAGGLYRLVRRDFVWGEAPALQVDDPVQRRLPRTLKVHALVRPLTREEKARAAEQAKGDLVGRDAEFAELHAAFHQATSQSDRIQIVCRVVFGEMGIGKTALVTAFLAELPSDVLIVHAECSPAQTELPYAAVGAWVRALTGVTADLATEVVEREIAGALGDLAPGRHGESIIARLADVATGCVPPAADETDLAHNRRLITSGVRRILARAATEHPVVIVVDGMSWCDRPSVELTAELVRWRDALPVLVLLVTRPDERITSILEGTVRVELKGLSAENQLRLLENRLGATGVAQVCADLLPRAAGNPFFLIEMVDALLERGTLELGELPDGSQQLIRVDRGDAAEPLPSTLEQLIADRLNELPLEERTTIDWLAVAGGPMAERDLIALGGVDAEDAIVRLCARGLCDLRNDLVDVRHPLARDVAYLGLEREVRIDMHRRLGEHLAHTPLARGLSAAIVARHLARGNARSEAAAHYLEAATTARNSYQTDLATRYFKRALRMLVDDDSRRMEVHEALEQIARVQGRGRERRRHLVALRRLARQSKNPLWVARALARTARLEQDQGYLARGLTSTQLAERVARQAGSHGVEIQAQSQMAELLRDLGDMQGALAACDRALGTAARHDVPPRLRADVLRTRGTLLRRVGRVHEAVDAHAEAIAVFKQVGARRSEAAAKNSLASALFVLGRFEDAIALSLQAIRMDLDIGGRLQIAKTLSTIGQCYARLGDPQRGLAYLRRAREAHERYGDQDARADTVLATAEVLIELGDLAAADSFVSDVGVLIANSGSAYDSVHEKIVRALVARASGDSSAAVMHAFDARQAAEAQAYVAYHFYAMAIEAAARCDIGEHHTGILLATTAVGAIETIQGSEYGLETRGISCEALRNAKSPQAGEMHRRAAAHARSVHAAIQDRHHAALFLRRPVVRYLLAASDGDAGATTGDAGATTGDAGDPRSGPERGPAP
ncbi:MAG: protein kinase [Polyangiaceae bacterium]|nr:protein kinase [Polyangiaceae bacterium]